MQTEAEAPVTEPLSFEQVTRRFGALTALEGVGLHVRADELVAIVGPSGCGKSTLLEIAAGLQEPDSGTGERGGRRRCGRAPRGLRLHAPARPAAPLARRARQRRARARVRGGAEARGAPARRAAVRALRPRGLRALAPRRPVGRHAPARGLPAHAAPRPARAAAGRALRRARRDHAARHAGVARRRARGGAAHGRARHPRRGGGGLPRRPRGGALAAAGARGGRVRGWAAATALGDRPGAARAEGAARWRRCADEGRCSPAC